MKFKEIISDIYVIPNGSIQKLEEITEEIHCPKGFELMNTSKTETYLYFIKNGIARAYLFEEKYDVTFWFGLEADPILSMKSYVSNMPSYENIQLLEDSVLYQIDTNKLKKLYESDIYIANWGRKFAERELIRTEERWIKRQFQSAKEKYKDLITLEPQILQRVPLGMIASYLGITQVSLSRIRAEF